MLNSAKFFSTRRSGGGGSFGQPTPPSSGLFAIRGINTAAKNTEKEDDLASVSPGYAVLSGVNAGLNKTFGIDDSSAKIFDDSLQDTITNVQNGKPLVDAVKQGISSLTSPQTGVSAKPVVYSDWTPVSRMFGMDQDTAFSEHLANTAHQREVADLKAAGLNPVLGISGSGATSVSGNSSVGASSALKADNNMLLDVLGATAAVVTAVATKNPMYGYMVSNIFKAFD